MVLMQLMSKGTNFLGSRYAILGGAMTWVSDCHLVAAISNAGGFGLLACGSMSPDLLGTEIAKTQALTTQPFGVNLITMHPQLSELINVCGQHKVSHVALAGGLPSKDMIDQLKNYGIKVICFAPALVIAKRLIKHGVDALIIEGNEAGGHIGPVTTSILVQEILPHIHDVPVFVAGGIGTGQMMVHYLKMGAAGVQLGTRFVCAHESRAHNNFKKMFIKSQGRHAVVSPQLDPRFPVIPVRALDNPGMQSFIAFQRQMIQDVDDQKIALSDAQLKIEHYWAGALRRAVIEGDIQQGSLMAGQSVTFVTGEQSVQDIIQELLHQGQSVQ